MQFSLTISTMRSITGRKLIEIIKSAGGESVNQSLISVYIKAIGDEGKSFGFSFVTQSF